MRLKASESLSGAGGAEAVGGLANAAGLCIISGHTTFFM